MPMRIVCFYLALLISSACALHMVRTDLGTLKQQSSPTFLAATPASTSFDEYSLYWDHLLLEEHRETIQQMRHRRSKWSPQRLEEHGLAISEAFAEPDSEVLGEKTVRIVAAEIRTTVGSGGGGSSRYRRPWSDVFTNGDVLEMTCLVQDEGNGFGRRRRQKSNAKFPPREGLIMEVGGDWMILGVGPTWPHGLWESRKNPQGYRVRLDRQTGPTAPLQAQRAALQKLRSNPSNKGKLSDAAKMLASSWEPCKNATIHIVSSPHFEECASKRPCFLQKVASSNDTGDDSLLQEGLQKALKQAMDKHQACAANSRQSLKPSKTWIPNDSQQSAVLWALQRQISLIRGPPGTGKTRTAALLISTALQLPNAFSTKQTKRCKQQKSVEPMRVLAVTHSNGAADVLLEALLYLGVPAVRAGRPATVAPRTQHRSVIALAEKLPHIKQLRQELLLQSARASSFSTNPNGGYGATTQWQLKKALEEAQAMLLQSAPVVVTSCIGAHQLSNLHASRARGCLFPMVVLDEAAQCTEPALLCALMAAQAQQVVLVGDTQQLPPTVTSSSQYLRQTLGTSPMPRLEAVGVHQMTLKVQYRMPTALLQHPSAYFYDGMVSSAVTDDMQKQTPPKGFDWPVPDQPLAFVHIGNSDSEVVHDTGSKSNPSEAKAVAEIAWEILQAGDVRAQDVAILTPYGKQVQAIRTALEEKALLRRQNLVGGIDNVVFSPVRNIKEGTVLSKELRNIKVGTIDSFQGQEIDVVLFSAVRSNPLAELGFLRDRRRLNVAITRARRGLILLGDSLVLSSCRHWQALIQSCKDRGCFVRKWATTTTTHDHTQSVETDLLSINETIIPSLTNTTGSSAWQNEEDLAQQSILNYKDDGFYGLFSVSNTSNVASLR